MKTQPGVFAIVKAIVASHGGDVTGENTEAGARFAISLPLAKSAADDLAASQSCTMHA